MNLFLNKFEAQPTRQPSRSAGGWLLVELYVALGIIVLVMIPISFSFISEQNACRGFYYRAVAMELVDGEMEILRAGAWRQLSQGRQIYSVSGAAAKNLPGQFIATRQPGRLRLEWQPGQRGMGGGVIREIKIDSSDQ